VSVEKTEHANALRDGLFIPKYILRLNDMTVNQKYVLSEIVEQCRLNDGMCRASNVHFIKFLGIPDTSVRDSINALIKKELIQKIAIKGSRTRILTLCDGLELVSSM